MGGRLVGFVMLWNSPEELGHVLWRLMVDASALATAEANGVAGRVRVTRDDAASTVADASVDLVVCNPPFHLGAAVVTAAADRLFTAAARLLRPGGELWTVYNNRLPHRAALRRIVGPTRAAANDRRYTVTVSTRR